MPGPHQEPQDPVTLCLCLHSVQVPWKPWGRDLFLQILLPVQGNFLEPKSLAVRFPLSASRLYPLAFLTASL